MQTLKRVYIQVNGKCKFRYRAVMEQHLGRELVKGESVHHINGIINDDRIENLQLINHSEHTRQHMTGNRNRRGKTLSEETRAKISDSLKGKTYRQNYNHSEETKRKISESQIKRHSQRSAL